jgi:hypothetical protein
MTTSVSYRACVVTYEAKAAIVRECNTPQSLVVRLQGQSHRAVPKQQYRIDINSFTQGC